MADLPRETAERLARELSSWHSIEVRIRVGLENEQPEPNEYASAEMEYHYIETAVGERLYEERHLPGAGPERFWASYADGRRFADASFAPGAGRKLNQVTIKPNFGNETPSDNLLRPWPIQSWAVGRIPLHKALAGATALGTGRHLGRDCELYLLTKARVARADVSLVYWLDRETAVPIRLDLYADESAREAGRPISTWAAESLDEVDGRHVPLRSVMTQFQPNAGPPPVPRLAQQLTIESIRFDGDYPATTFWPTMEPGTKVVNTITKQFTTIPGGPEQAGSTLEARPTRDWTPWITGGCVALGVVLVVAAIVTWFKRR